MMISDKITYLKRQKLDLLVLTEEDAIQTRIQEMGHRFRLAKRYFPDIEAYKAESSTFNKIPVVLFTRPEDIEVLLQTTPTSFFVLLVNEAMTSENVQELKRRGVSAVMDRQEFLDTVKFDFVCLYKIRAPYFPISLQDIFPMTTMTFNASIRLPLNQKFLAVIFKNFTLSEEKYKKIEREGRLFIRNRDTADFLRYILTYNDGLGTGMRKRCKALFLCLAAQYLSLMELLLFTHHADESEAIQAAFQNMESLCTEIVGYIKGAANVDLWEVFREALVNEIFEYYRGPWIAVYAALIAEKSQRGNPVAVMMAALLGEIGWTEAPRELFFTYAEAHQDPAAIDDPLARDIPAKSLALGAERKIPWSEEVQKIIEHWQPQRASGEIAVDAWILQMADQMDRGVRTYMEENKVTFQYWRKTLLEQKSKADSGYPPDVVAAFAPILT